MTDNNDQKLLLATVTAFSSTAGVEIRLDGQDEPISKRFKYIYTGSTTLYAGARVLVAKMSGTYVIIGRLQSIS